MLAQKLTEIPGVELSFAREANGVFVRLGSAVVRQLQERGWHFYKFVEPDVYRLMCAWSVTEREIEEFVGEVKEIVTTSID
jgi:threonine aldolase